MLYRLRKKRRHDADDHMFMEVISAALGKSYYHYWLRYKLSRLTQNVRRTWRKYVKRELTREIYSPRIPTPLREVTGHARHKIVEDSH